MDEETEDEQPPFRMNRQVVAILGLTAVMLAVPFAGIAYWLSAYLAPPRPPAALSAPQVNTQPLVAALEHSADTQLGAATSLDDSGDRLVIKIPVDQIGPRIQRISELATAAGGSALEMSGPQDAARRLTIQVPASRRDLLRRAINGEKIDFASVPPSADTAILNVELERP